MFYIKVKGRGYLSRHIETTTWAFGIGDNGSNYKCTHKLEFKRAINDIKGDFAFKTKDALLKRISKLKKVEKLSDKDKSTLINYEIIVDDAIPAKKRYLISRHKNAFVDIELGTGRDYNPECCTACGYTISINEPYAKFKGIDMCAHCINDINLRGKELMDNMDGAYETQWLMERITKEI